MSTALFQSEALLDESKELMRDKKYAEAASALRAALEIRKSAIGDKDVSIAQLLDELGVALAAAGQVDEAMQCFSQALTILEAIYYPGHAWIAPVLMHMVDIYLAQNKLAEAEPLCQRALAIDDKALTGEHRQTLECTLKLATIYMKLAKNADAEKLLTKATKQVDTPLGPLEEFQFLLAQISELEGKKDDADKLYKSAALGYEQRRNYSRLAACLSRYGEFLRKENRKDEANVVDERAKKFKEFSSCMNPNEDLFPSTLLRA